MLDTTPVTTEITRLIATGTTEQALLVAVAHLFPELTPAELSQALQVATRPICRACGQRGSPSARSACDARQRMTTLREEREHGIALRADTARKLEGYVRFGLGQSAE